MIFNLLEEFGIIYLRIFLLIRKGFRTFILKGSRGSRKTTLIVKWIIKDMVRDHQASAVVCMNKKVDHSERTMREIESWIMRFAKKYWKNFETQYVKLDSQTLKKYIYNNNYGGKQEIQFVGIDELSKGGLRPPLNNYFKYFWLEEPTSSKEQYGLDRQEKIEKYSGIETWLLTALRHLSQFEKAPWETQREFKSREKTKGITKFFSLNPYNKEDPMLDNFHKYLKDDEKLLLKQGFQYAINYQEKEVYMTTNYLLNKFLPPEFIQKMEQLRLNNYEWYKVVGLGMSGKTKNNSYSDIWHLIEPYQTDGTNKEVSKLWSFKNFRIGLDVGGGGQGKMAMTLVGKRDDNIWIPLREWDSEQWQKQNKFDPASLSIFMYGKLKEWEDEFYELKKYTRDLVMDNDPSFRLVFQNASIKYLNQYGGTKTRYKYLLFLGKYNSTYKNEDRVPLFKYMLVSGGLKIYKNLTPKLYEQFENHKLVNGRYPTTTKNDDVRQSFEIAMFDKIGDVLRNTDLKSPVIDREVRDFLNQNKNTPR